MTQGQALTILKTGANVFLTGEPGSGKTYVINEYVRWLQERGIEPAITAATGIAATHISGMTIHSWSGIGVREELTPADIDQIATKEHVARRVAKAPVLIIDEISMLSARTFEAANEVCREIRRGERTFGGMQVVMVGDFFQLPPVSKYRETHFAYESNAWRELNPIVCYLSEQHRQEDADYLEVLTAIRRGEVEEMHFERINTRRVAASAGLPAQAGVPRLYSHNADVDRENAVELAGLPGKVHRFLMNSKGGPNLIEGLKRGCLSPEVLELKEGAAVMFTKNAPQGKYANGTLGTVVDFMAGGLPVVETRGGEYITVEPVDWQLEENGKVRASITQLPLRLAYALTIHKSQGQSLDAALIDLSKAFEYGQGYVALSRVRTLAGLHLLGINDRALMVHPDILEKDRDFRLASGAAAETFATMPPDEIEQMQKNFVMANGGEWIGAARGAATKNIAAKKSAGRLSETLEAVRSNKSLAAAAKARGLTIGTIVTHLEKLNDVGTLVPKDFMHLLPPKQDLERIQLAIATKGGDKLAPIYSALKGRYDYETIRLVLLATPG